MLNAASEATTLVVFCRRPALGSGKRRLARELGDPATLAISELLLATTLEDVATWAGHRVIAPAEPGDEAWVRSLPVPVDAVLPQPSGNLGVRLAGVDRVLRDQGHTRLLYIGSDAPVLAHADYLAACHALTTHDVVLGPALDGGVTFLGGRQAWPELAHLPWGSETLHAALQAICERAGLTVRNLPPRYDVDVPADLRRLCADLAGDVRPARLALYRALHSLGYCGS
jgi:rSAM/selenodomain-associated transferase 1